jgi:6-phosphogluconolactonase
MSRDHFQATLAAIIGCAALPLSAAQPGNGELVYFGTHTPAACYDAKTPAADPVVPGMQRGLFAARFDATSGHLTAVGFTAPINCASWAVADPRRSRIYAVSEIGNDGSRNAEVFSLAVDRATGALKILNRVDSEGSGATHLALDPKSNTLLVADYISGRVASIPVLTDGSLGKAATVLQDEGTGPNPNRQEAPHAHAVAVDPSGRFVLTADLGADKIFVRRLDAGTHQLTPSTPPFETVTAGAGPRHLVFHPNGKFLFLDTELTAEVRSYRWDSRRGRLTLLQTISADAPNHDGSHSVAEIAVGRDGRHLYVSNRRENTLVVYDINPATGMLAFAQRIDCGGKIPWSFGLDPSGRWLLVANEVSNTVNVFRIDAKSGQLAATSDTLAVPAPSDVLFLPAR